GSSGWTEQDLNRIATPLARLLDVAAERERAAARGAEAEAARQADAAKTVILHAVSHDLRSPLTAIRTAAAGLREEGPTAEDRGAGVPVAQRNAIFKPFHTGDERDGAGLGLAICKGFVEANGGELRLQADAGDGTAFAVSFPLVEQPATVG